MHDIDDMKQEENIPVIFIDQEGIITYVNALFEKVFQWDQKDIVGQSVTVIIPKALHDAHHLGFSRFITTEQPTLLNKPLNLSAMKKDGTCFKAEHIICAQKKDKKWIIAATIRPLDDH